MGKPTQQLMREAKDMRTSLALLEAVISIQRLDVKFRKHGQGEFFHQVLLASPSVQLLRIEIARRLRVEINHIRAIVKQTNLLVEFDEDICENMELEVYL